MGIFSFISSKIRNLFNKIRGRSSSSSDINYNFLYRNKEDYQLASSEDIFSAVTRISNTFASVKFYLYKDGKRIVNHSLNDLLSLNPNKIFTAFDHHRTLESFRLTNGNGYGLIIPDGYGNVKQIDIIDPERVDVLLDDEFGELWYKITPLENSKMFYVSSSSMIHVKQINTSGFKGISPIEVLKGTVQYNNEIKRFNLDKIRGIADSVILEVPSAINIERKSEMINEFTKAYRESNGTLMVLDAGVKAIKLAGSGVDSKVLEAAKITTNKVAGVYQLPPHMIGSYGENSSKNSEEAMLEYLQFTILPILNMYLDEYNKKLLKTKERKEGYYFAFDVNDITLIDTKTRTERNFKNIRTGVMSPNEARAQEKLPPKAGGDELYVSRDLIPLDMVKDTTLQDYLKTEAGKNNSNNNDEKQEEGE